MLTLKNLYMKYDGNQPFIFGDRNDLNPNSIQALVTGAPYVADKLYELKQNIWNEVLTFLGVPNVQMNKKERLYVYFGLAFMCLLLVALLYMDRYTTTKAMVIRTQNGVVTVQLLNGKQFEVETNRSFDNLEMIKVRIDTQKNEVEILK